MDDGRHERVLGVNWKFDSDAFTFVVDLPWKPRTKRDMLATINAVFITLIVLEAKLLYRNLCQKKLDWNESMPAEDLLRWERWLESLMHLRMVSIPRWLGLDSSKDNQACQLHCFVDVSQLAYGAVS